MKPEDKLHKDLWWMLEAIKREQILFSNNNMVDFIICPEGSPTGTGREIENLSVCTQIELLEKLKEWDALDFKEIPRLTIEIGGGGLESALYRLTINTQRFDELYYSYEHVIPNNPAKGGTAEYNRPIIGKKALKLIAGHISDLMTHRELTEFFTELGVPLKFHIEGSKVDRVYSVLTNLTYRDKAILFKLIEEVVHPLMYGGDVNTATEVERKFNNWIGYDGFMLRDGKIQEISPKEPVGDMSEINPEPNLASLEELANYYFRLMGVIDLHFESKQKGNKRLNEIYLQLCDKIEALLQATKVQHLKNGFQRPFRTLFSAQKEVDEKRMKLREVRNNMSAFYGEIHRVLIESQEKKAEETDLAEIDEYISKQASLLPKVSSKNKNHKGKSQQPIDIRIVPESEIKIKGAEPQSQKGKSIVPLQLPSNTVWEDITIRFVDGHNVKISVKDKIIAKANYKEMGFEDSKKLLPNKQWEILRLLAETGGELSWGKPYADDKVKKKKQLLSQALKAYFQIDQDPFLSYKQEKAYKIIINLIPE